MAENSAIEWTDHTFNPWRGCTHAVLPDGTPHQGCINCYAEAMAPRNPKALGVWGDDGTRVVGAESYWELPLKWERQADARQQWYSANRSVDAPRPRVFCASLADIFEDFGESLEQVGGGAHFTRDGDPSRMVPNKNAVGTDMDGYHYTSMADVRSRLFALIDATPNLDWIILTKRPQNVRRMWPATSWGGRCAMFPDCTHPDCIAGRHRSNVWLLTSISDQASADAMIPPLLECRDLVPVLGLSAEPLVGPVRLRLDMGLGWQCERCGGTGRQEAGCWDGRAYAAPAGVCDTCLGECRTGNWLKWIICGGESGHHARPMHPQWARSLRDQCQAAGVPFFMKQMGGTKKPFAEIPGDLFVREFPNA